MGFKGIGVSGRGRRSLSGGSLRSLHRERLAWAVIISRRSVEA
jgi:hypothetical protein